jgi:Ca-activated chloride channel family protein
VIATDGYVSVEEQAFDLIRNNLGNANMFAFGIGSSVNRHIIEGMAHVGMGEPFVITKPEEAASKAEAFRTLIQSPVLTQIKVNFNGFDVYDVEPKAAPDLLADRPIVMFGKWRGKPKGSITLTGITGTEHYKDSIDVNSVMPLAANSALQQLWARQRIMLLADYNMLRHDDERVKEVTNLGLTYNLLTAYTSFVAVDSETRNKDDKTTTVNQPLPLPEGVSDHAVGGMVKSAMPSAPMERRIRSSADAAPMPAKEEVSSASGTAQKKKASGIRIVKIEVSEGLSKDEIEKIVHQHMGKLRDCAARAGLSGNVVITLSVQADGTVAKAAVATGAGRNAGFEQCCVQTVNVWKFPAGQAKERRVTITLSVKP